MEKTYYFTGGKTPPETFPTEGLIEAAGKVLRELGGAFAFYPRQHAYAGHSVKGYVGLREVASARFEHREGVPLPVENVVITTGSMQAIELLGRTFIRPGDIVITEELSYYGTLQFFRYMQANIVGVPLDERDGMDVGALEDLLRHLAKANVKPKFVYVIPNHHNPTDAIMTRRRREELLELAIEYDVPIVEDDCYGDLDFEPGIIPPSIFTLDEDRSHVIFVGSFSKIVGPGVRLGYFCAPDRFLDAILAHRWDLGTSILASAILAEYLKDHLWEQVARQVEAIKKRRDVLLKALKEYLGDVARWNEPRGGLFLWVKLPEEIDMAKLKEAAEKRAVRFDEGQKFHYKGEKLKALRLSYAHIPVEDIPEGIRLLAEAVEEAMS